MDCSLDSEHTFQVSSNIFSNNRNIRKCQKFLHDDDTPAANEKNIRVIPLPWVFSENGQAKNAGNKCFLFIPNAPQPFRYNYHYLS